MYMHVLSNRAIHGVICSHVKIILWFYFQFDTSMDCYYTNKKKHVIVIQHHYNEIPKILNIVIIIIFDVVIIVTLKFIVEFWNRVESKKKSSSSVFFSFFFVKMNISVITLGIHKWIDTWSGHSMKKILNYKKKKIQECCRAIDIETRCKFAKFSNCSNLMGFFFVIWVRHEFFMPSYENII